MAGLIGKNINLDGFYPGIVFADVILPEPRRQDLRGFIICAGSWQCVAKSLGALGNAEQFGVEKSD